MFRCGLFRRQVTIRQNLFRILHGTIFLFINTSMKWILSSYLIQTVPNKYLYKDAFALVHTITDQRLLS